MLYGTKYPLIQGYDTGVHVVRVHVYTEAVSTSTEFRPGHAGERKTCIQVEYTLI